MGEETACVWGCHARTVCVFVCWSVCMCVQTKVTAFCGCNEWACLCAERLVVLAGCLLERAPGCSQVPVRGWRREAADSDSQRECCELVRSDVCLWLEHAAETRAGLCARIVGTVSMGCETARWCDCDQPCKCCAGIFCEFLCLRFDFTFLQSFCPDIHVCIYVSIA